MVLYTPKTATEKWCYANQDVVAISAANTGQIVPSMYLTTQHIILITTLLLVATHNFAIKISGQKIVARNNTWQVNYTSGGILYAQRKFCNDAEGIK